MYHLHGSRLILNCTIPWLVQDQITELRFELVTRRTSANRRENVEWLLRMLLQQLASVGKMTVPQ